jgi:hypothetical protein
LNIKASSSKQPDKHQAEDKDRVEQQSAKAKEEDNKNQPPVQRRDKKVDVIR